MTKNCGNHYLKENNSYQNNKIVRCRFLLGWLSNQLGGFNDLFDWSLLLLVFKSLFEPMFGRLKYLA